MTTKRFIACLLIAGLISMFCALLSAAPTSQPAIGNRGDLAHSMQELLDAGNDAGLNIKAIQALYSDRTQQTVTPVVSSPTTAPATRPAPSTAPATKPAPKQTRLVQDKKTWAYQLGVGSKASLTIRDIDVTNGGIIHAQGGDTIDVFNCSNEQGSPNGGMYTGMFWPASGQCIPHVLWDNSGITAPIVQGSAECAIRGKIDDAHFIGCTFVAYLQKNGQPWKQVVEIRAGKKWLFENCTFKNGWPDIGQQKIFLIGYDKSQHVGTVTFSNCKFTRWSDAKRHKVYSRQPGVDHVVFINCTDPDGQKFSKSE